MLTPIFKLSQNDDTLTITVYAPNARLQDTEVTASDNLFYFTSPPYFLRLHLPHNIKDSETQNACQATFDAASNSYIITCQKEEPGQYFPGLDMLTNLLTPKASSTVPNIEVLSSSTDDAVAEKTQLEEKEDEANNFEEFYEPQKLPEPTLTEGPKYGFANKYSNIPVLEEGLYGVLDLPSPNSTPVAMRRQLRREDEARNFKSEHYLADVFEGSATEHINFVPQFRSWDKSKVEYSREEETALLQLPRREILVDAGQETNQVCAGLVSLLLSWSYNHRITAAEPCVASAWNITKLAPQLSWFDTVESVEESLRVFARRCAVFPLMRDFSFVAHLVGDAAALLKLGRKMVVKCLLEMRHIFNETENYYLLNDLYITDYLLWLQHHSSDQQLDALADVLLQVKLKKCHLELDLEVLEEVARKAVEADSSPPSPAKEAVAVDSLNTSLQALTFSNPAHSGSSTPPAACAAVLNGDQTVSDATLAADFSEDSEESSSDSDSSDSSDESSSGSESSSDSDDSSELDSDDDDEPQEKNV